MHNDERTRAADRGDAAPVPPGCVDPAEGLRLMRAFLSIECPALRARIVALMDSYCRRHHGLPPS